MILEKLQDLVQQGRLPPEEWHRHANGGGWVETATVDIDESVYIAPDAIVAGHSRLRKAGIGEGCLVLDSTILESRIAEYSEIRGSTIERAQIEECRIDASQIADSSLESVELVRSSAQDRSRLANVNIFDSAVSESVVEDSWVERSRIEKLSTVAEASSVEDSQIFNSVIKEETVTGKNRRDGKEVTGENPWAEASRSPAESSHGLPTSLDLLAAEALDDLKNGRCTDL